MWSVGKGPLDATVVRFKAGNCGKNLLSRRRGGDRRHPDGGHISLIRIFIPTGFWNKGNGTTRPKKTLMTSRPTKKAVYQFLSRSRLRGVTTVDDRIRVRNRVVREAIVLVVNLRDPFLCPTDVRRQVAKAVLVRRTALDTSQRDDGVIEDPSDVRRGSRRGVGGAAGQNLCDEVRGEGRDVADNPFLFDECDIRLSGPKKRTRGRRDGRTRFLTMWSVGKGPLDVRLVRFKATATAGKR